MSKNMRIVRKNTLEAASSSNVLPWFSIIYTSLWLRFGNTVRQHILMYEILPIAYYTYSIIGNKICINVRLNLGFNTVLGHIWLMMFDIWFNLYAALTNVLSSMSDILRMYWSSFGVIQNILIQTVSVLIIFRSKAMLIFISLKI